MARAFLVLLLATVLGCASHNELAPGALTPPPAAPPSTEETFGAPASLLLDRSQLRASGASPRLLAGLDSSVYRYFRALAAEYASRVCFEFRDARWRLPVAAVHGDAHVEQLVSGEKVSSSSHERHE